MKTTKAGIYIRVSTSAQNTESQEAELKAYSQKRGWTATVYEDKGQSGIKESRPALDALMRDCRKRKLDVVVVWSMDRLARSLQQLLKLLEEFRQLGIEFVALNQQIDTSIPAGRLAYQVLGAVAEFEREMLRDRVRAGLRNARAKGRRLGRPALKRFDADERLHITEEHKKGKSVRRLAAELGTTQWMIGQILRQEVQC